MMVSVPVTPGTPCASHPSSLVYDLPQRSLYLELTGRCLISMSSPVVMSRTAFNISIGNFLQDALRAVMCWLVMSL